MAQDRMSSWDEEGEVRGFDDRGLQGSDDIYDVDPEDDNPHLWESEAELSGGAGSVGGFAL